MRLLVLDGDLVVNIIEADEDFEHPGGLEVVPDPGEGCGIGWTRDGETWTPPDLPPELPSPDSLLQAQLDDIADAVLTLVEGGGA